MKTNIAGQTHMLAKLDFKCTFWRAFRTKTRISPFIFLPITLSLIDKLTNSMILFIQIFTTSKLLSCKSQGPEIFREFSSPHTCHMSLVIFHVLHVMFYMSHVTFCKSIEKEEKKSTTQLQSQVVEGLSSTGLPLLVYRCWVKKNYKVQFWLI